MRDKCIKPLARHLRFCFYIFTTTLQFWFLNPSFPQDITSTSCILFLTSGFSYSPDTHVLQVSATRTDAEARAYGYCNPSSSLTWRIHLQDSVNSTLSDSSQLFRILEESNYCSIFIIHLPCQSFFPCLGPTVIFNDWRPYFALWPDDCIPRGQ